MRKLFSLFPLLICLLATPVSSETLDELLDEISGMQTLTEDIKVRLEFLIDHQAQDVAVKARMRLARLTWVAGNIELAESILTMPDDAFNQLNRENKIKMWFSWTEFENRRNNFVKSEEYAFKAVQLAQPDFHLLPRAYLGYGNALRQQMKWLDAKKYLELAVEGYEKEGNPQGLSYSLNTLGIMYTSLSDLAKALEYQQRARVYFEEHGSDQEIAASYYNIGEIYEKSGEPEKALEYYQRTLELDIKMGDLYNIGYDYIGIANILYDIGQYTQALQNSQKAVEPLIQVDASRELARAYLQQADIHAKLNNQEQRYKSLELARQYADETGTLAQTLAVDYSFGRYFLEQEAYPQALDMLTKSLKAARDLSLNNKKREAHELLAKTYQQTGQIDQAFFHLQQTLELQALLNTEDQRERTERYKRDVNLLEEQLKVTQLEQSKAQKEQELQSQRATQQRLYLVMIVFAVLFITGLFVLWQKRKLTLLRVKLYEETLQQKNQLLADVSHELRTPLTALQLKVEALQHNLVEDVDASYERLIEKISDINRMISDIYQLAQSDIGALSLHILDEDMPELLTHWADEFADVVEAKGFKWRMQNDLTNAVTAAIDKDRIKQVMANLISNSIAYTDSPGTIALAAHNDNTHLYLSVSDTAPGVDQDKLKKLFERLYRVEASRSRATGGSGLGLSICKSIIESHNGKIRARASDLGGLKIEMKIPLSQGR